jgi:hypothetical protein
MQDKDTSEFNFSYLPAQVAAFFADALGCYRHELYQAFAAMCRCTVQATCDYLGEGTKLKLFDQVEEIANLADIDDHAHRNLRNILFDTDTSSISEQLDRETAAVLLETIKDVLYQSYVRRELLRKKLKMRRFFAAQSDQEAANTLEDPKVFPIKTSTGND